VTDVSLTVNGTEVALAVEPRLTLADALRHRLGLTGTHLGCEHGVCGACTVLVNGAAVRSCLLFCVQADGCEVTTVEALGEVDDLHPLQEAFRRHHGLQCGFCTPGFLISAYELLRDGPDGLDEGRLREELSGVLCRCTGYEGIVAAVREVAAAHPDGLPAPKVLGRPITVRGAVLPPGEERAVEALSAAPTAPAPPARADLAPPTGRPNETVEVTTTIAAAPDATWTLLSDFMRMSRCMPGVELDTDHGDGTYSGRVRVHLGPMRMDFAGAARVHECDRERRTLRVIAAGRDRSGGGVRVDVILGAQPSEGACTAVRAEAKVFLTGRAAGFGRSLAGDVSRQLFSEFGSCLERTLVTGQEVAPPRLAGGVVTWRLLSARFRALLRRLAGRGPAS
jgi:carbon-monoxide dehydrogenase small subunit